jgi:TM2 domain-containing membrane protein YozV
MAECMSCGADAVPGGECPMCGTQQAHPVIPQATRVVAAAVSSVPAMPLTQAQAAGVAVAATATALGFGNTPVSVSVGAPGAIARKNATLAAVLSFLIVGLGQLYNGQAGKGIFMFIGCVCLWFILLGWIINIWSIIDAYKTAERINAGCQA